MAGTCKCGNEHLGSMKFGEFLNWLKTGLLPKKDSVLWSKQASKQLPMLLTCSENFTQFTYKPNLCNINQLDLS